MKTNIARYFVMAVGILGLAGAPAAFAGDLRRDYREAGRDNADIRHDERRLRDDREDGRYWQAARDRAALNRDYRERDREIRDIRHDRHENYYRYGWR